jgi:hypothetical protein
MPAGQRARGAGQRPGNLMRRDMPIGAAAYCRVRKLSSHVVHK